MCGFGGCMQFVPAKREQARARIGLVGPSGSGKTYSGLHLARGIAGPEGRVAVIDTEQHSAALYSHITPFDVLCLDGDYSPARYIEALRVAEAGKYDVVLIDSLSHAWAGIGGILDQVDAAAAKASGNKFAAWRVASPKHAELVDAILQSPCHIVATMRAKTEWAVEQDERGKSKPRKVGTAPVQRDGMEYEFTTVLELDIDHYATASKDRTSLYDGKRFVIGENTGRILRGWLDAGPVTAAVLQAYPAAQVVKPIGVAVDPYGPATTAPAAPAAAPAPVLAADPKGLRKELAAMLWAMCKQDQQAARAECLRLTGYVSPKQIPDNGILLAYDSVAAAHLEWKDKP